MATINDNETIVYYIIIDISLVMWQAFEIMKGD
jgi:hypothetical protein